MISYNWKYLRSIYCKYYLIYPLKKQCSGRSLPQKRVWNSRQTGFYGNMSQVCIRPEDVMKVVMDFASCLYKPKD